MIYSILGNNVRILANLVRILPSPRPHICIRTNSKTNTKFIHHANERTQHTKRSSKCSNQYQKSCYLLSLHVLFPACLPDRHGCYFVVLEPVCGSRVPRCGIQSNDGSHLQGGRHLEQQSFTTGDRAGNASSRS